MYRDYSALFKSTLESAGASVALGIENFEKQVASDPDTVDKFFWLGAAYMVGAFAQKDVTYLDKAIGFYEKALEIDPKHKNTYAKLLGVYISKNDNQGARQTAMRWARVDPDLPAEVRQWLTQPESITPIPQTAEKAISEGRALYQDGKFDEAIELLEKALSVYKGNTSIAELLSTVLSDRGGARFSQMGQPELSLKDLLRATEVNPQNWRALVNLCTVAQGHGDFELALQSGQRALALHPELRSNSQFKRQLSALEKIRRNENLFGKKQSNTDDLLIATAKVALSKAILSGVMTCEIPAHLFNNASKQAQDKVRTVCGAVGMPLILK
jgi:tetratricopeptide (TPR) repeat protein